MVKSIFILMLINFSFSTFSQKTKQSPTLKQSVEEVKASGKAIADLFKKKNKVVTDSTAKNKTVDDDKTAISKPNMEKIFSTDSIIDSQIKELIIAHILTENKKEKYKFTKTEAVGYLQFELNFGAGIKSTYYFSTLKKENPSGDLNLDGQDDLIVQLSSNFGGNSDNISLYIFLKENSGWKLALIKATSDEKLKGCKIGSFTPISIEKGFLFCESYCYTDSDPRCCPSLKYKTLLKWENNDLRFVKKEKF